VELQPGNTLNAMNLAEILMKFNENSLKIDDF
jgi:hypothetical protein